jgi:hypothetical protein
MSNNPDPAAEIAAAAAGAEQAPEPGGAFDVKELGPDCPITPLGFLKQKFYFLDFAGQLIELGSEFRKGELMALFGTRMGWLEASGRSGKRSARAARGKPIVRARRLFAKAGAAGADHGLFQARAVRPQGQGARARRASRRHGELVCIAATRCWSAGARASRSRAAKARSSSPGLVGGYVYPTLDALPRPADEAATRRRRQANPRHARKLELEARRHCRAPAALLDRRRAARRRAAHPPAWLDRRAVRRGQDDAAEFLRELMGDWGVFTEDATEAGVRQLLDQDTLAVMFDEIEAEEDNQGRRR